MKRTSKSPTIETLFLNHGNSPCNGIENINIIVHKRRLHHHRKRNRNNENAKQIIGVPFTSSNSRKSYSKISKRFSMPEFTKDYKKVMLKVSTSETTKNTPYNPYKSQFSVNVVSQYREPECLNPFNNALANVKWRVYRCQLSTQDESCCCQCNSDAMFEVMKSLYDCYKKKNCDTCNCILCGHLPREERKLGEQRKLGAKVSSVGVETEKAKAERAKRKEKTKKAELDMAGKSEDEKEKILRGLAASRTPLPVGKTQSDKKLIDKVRKDMGLPPEPKTATESKKYQQAMAAGIITPLEGKSKAQKEKILKNQAEAGLPLPEGRTPSEKALIAKITAETVRAPSAMAVPSEKLRKAKAAGFLTPLEGKTPEQKEKILRGLAANRIPLPEGKTPSEKKLIDKVRKDMGLPPEPKTSAEKKKYQQAMAAGIITPLEGKSKAQKEKILKNQAEAGLPLPEGRTPSEKALIAKIKAETVRAPSAMAVPSEKLRKAKAAGFLTPLEGKTPEQKEKILRGLAANRIPLPEGKTPSEKKLIDKVRKDMGLTPEPKTSAEKKKYQQAMAAGIITPLEGKSKAQKEKILKNQAEAGLPLPEGRTPSEKALIAKIKAETVRAPSAMAVPSEKLRKAKAAGFLTPLEGKTPEQKEKILRGLAANRIPLPEGKTPSEKKLIDKVRKDMGLPPEPKTSAEKKKYQQAMAAGIITPLEGKSKAQREKILKNQAEAGLPLPEGRTPSEKALISKIKAETVRAPSAMAVPSEKLRKAKAAGFLTPLEGKTPEQKEKILRGLAANRIPLPEGKTPSEKKLIDKVRKDMGLPPEPKTSAEKKKYQQAMAAGIITPLEGKSKAQKENILKNQAEAGLPLPEGRTPSEKALIAKIKAETVRAPSAMAVPSEKLRKAKAAGFLTPLEGKTPEQKEKILRGLAANRIPLPEGKTPSEKKLIDKVRKDMGLPPEPKTSAEKKKYQQAMATGIITPLEGKSKAQKEKILKNQAEAGLPLPEGRTPSEKALIAKIKAETVRAPSAMAVPSEKLRKAKAAGFLTPLEGKTPEQKEKILRGLAANRIPLPEGKTPSEKKLIDKVRKDMGLTPEPKTSAEKKKYQQAMAAGIITPLEGKSKAQKEKILKNQAEAGLPLPEGRTPSEKALIAKIKATTKPPAEGAPSKLSVATPSEKLRKAKAAGLITPLAGKTPENKEKILRGLAAAHIPLPEGQTLSEKKLIAKVRDDMGLPPEPKTGADREKYNKAFAAGIITPLEGKNDAQKAKILRAQVEAGIPLPIGRTASEKALIEKVKAATGARKKTKSRAVAAGVPALPLEQRQKLDRKTAKNMKEGKGPSDECICGLLTPESERVSAKPAKPSKIQSEMLRKAKAAGLLTPLAGKSPEQREKILKGLVKQGIPLPEPKTASEKNIIDKVRKDLGMPPEPKTQSMREKYAKAQAQGIMTPLEGKSPAQKEKILKAQAEAGIPLPEGRTPSEKALINKIKAAVGAPSVARIPSEKLRKAKAAGLLTPLAGKSPAQREKILKGLVKQGIPLPEPKTASERNIIDKVRKDLGLPPEPKTPSMKEKYAAAHAQGIMTPLEGKSPTQKEKILKAQAEAGIPLPEGRTPSEKALINKVKAAVGAPSVARIPSEKLRKAKAAGLLTPLAGKSPAQREKILKGLVKQGIPLPEPKTASEKNIIDKVRQDLGMPPEPKTQPMREKYAKAQAQGIMTPLEGKSPAQKEKILKAQAEAGIPLPEGRTPSEKALINKIKAAVGAPSVARIPSEKLRKAKAAGLLTPLAGKTPAQREKILKGLVKQGIPLPEPKTASEKNIIDKVRKDLGLPPEPKTPSMKEKYAAAHAQGIMTPLEGKSPAQKEKILKAQAEAGIPLPEGRTPSEKALINKIKATVGAPSVARIPSEKLRKAKAAGLLTPLAGKSPAQREKILKGLVKQGIPLPEPKTASEKNIIDKVRQDLGMPPEPKTQPIREKYAKAQAQGIMTPLEGKSPAQKEKILKAQAEAGIPLPEGRTPSEKALINKIKAAVGAPSVARIPSEKLRKAKAAGLLTPLAGKSPEQREKILKGLVKQGIPLPEPKTASEKNIIDRVRKDLGLPPEPKTPSMKEKYAAAHAQGIMTPLEGKSPAQKEKILKAQAEAGIPLPEGRTPSEKALINKIKAAVGAPSVARIPSEKLRKAKAAGLLTPLAGKSPEQREKILKGLVKQGIPLPEPKTASEKNIIDKVRKDLGLPPEPKTPSVREKYAKAQAQGIMTPLEGKSPAQKEKILKAQAEAGIPLPEGRTPSEKALINKIKAAVGAPSVARIPSEKIRKAKAAGLLTPLAGKTPEQREKILKGLIKQGIPLPEPKTASERNIIDKVRKDLGLPPEPKTPSMKEKYAAAHAQGIMTPLEGKSPAQKEKILKAQAEAGIPLPEGRTPSEKALINKIKAAVGAPSVARIPSEKLRKAKAAGLLTPLAGKSPEQREKILKGLVKQGIPLPEPKTASEKNIIDKVRKDLGMPPEPKTPSMREKYAKAQAQGIMTPLEGKSPAQKEKILKAQAEAGIPLPEGRTPSEKSLIKKIQAELGAKPSKKGPPTPLSKEAQALDKKTAKVMKEGKGPSDECICGILTPESEKVSAKAAKPSKIPSEKLKKAKAAGLMTPLAGKSPEQKEKILKGLVKQGIPLPEPKTASEKNIIDKVRKDTGLPPEPKTSSMKEKYAAAQAQGTMTPLEGKSPAQKEKILKAQAEAGIPLPEGRTPSEKALINKIKASVGAPSVARIPSEKLRKAKAAGLLTPLTGKSPAQREKILKGLVKQGIPLPEPNTASEKNIIDKVRKDLGMPPEPKTPSMREKYAKAQAQGIMTPLEGKSPAQKEKILKAQAEAGIPLPEGRTPSEKALINKIIASVGAPSVARIPSEKLRKAKTAGLLTPLAGKSAVQKEKILKGLAEAGLPLPEGKTPSEKALVHKVKTEHAAVTPSEKEIVRKAKADGLLTPLAGKTKPQKEKIVIGLIDAGLPVPEGKRASEKSLIKKVRTAAGLPPEATASEKLGKIRTKSKKVGAAPSKRIAKGVGGTGISKAGIVEEFQDISKTTTCEKGCGCDKKKIRFKHSYVKIRVTSPDISSLCPCPNECIPGVKGGVLVDNEGIKVTVGSAVGFPKFSAESASKVVSNKYSSKAVNSLETKQTSQDRDNSICELYFNKEKDFRIAYKNINMDANYSNESLSIFEGEKNIYKENMLNYYLNELDIQSDRCDTSTSRFLIACSESFVTSSSESFTSLQDTSCNNMNSESSLNSIMVVKTESSLSFSTKSNISIRTISIASFHNSNIISTSSHYLCYECSKSATNVSAADSEYFTNVIDYSAVDSLASESKEVIKYSVPVDEVISDTKQFINNDAHVFRISNMNLSYDVKNVSRSIKDPRECENNDEPIIVINYLNSHYDIMGIVDEILAKDIASSSSVFVVVPTSDEYDTDLTDSVSSTICIQISENFFNWTNKLGKESRPQKRSSSKKAIYGNGLKISARGKQFLLECTHNKVDKQLNCPTDDDQLNSPQVDNQLNCPKFNKKLHCPEFDKQHNCPTFDKKLNCPELDEQFNCPTFDKKLNCHEFDEQFNCPTFEKKLNCPESDKQLNCPKFDKNLNCPEFDEELNCPEFDKQPNCPKMDKQLNSPETTQTTVSLNKICQVNSSVIMAGVRSRTFSMDTTQDRPCCCSPCESNSPNEYGSKEQYVATAFSEIITPVILEQGLGHGTFFNIRGLDLTEFKTQLCVSKQTSVSLCEVPPCSPSYPNCHNPPPMPQQNYQPYNLNHLRRLTPNDSQCKCITTLLEPKPRNQPGGLVYPHNVNFAPLAPCAPPGLVSLIPAGIIDGKQHPCTTCGRPTMKDGRTISCLCSGKEKKIQLPSVCPCEAHKPEKSEIVSTAVGPNKRPEKLTRSVAGQAKINKKLCICDGSLMGKKNTYCECPESDEEPLFNAESYQGNINEVYIDEVANRKIKSDQTQTISGFRFDIKKRPPVVEEMSFEDALKYYEEHPDDPNCLCDKYGIPLSKAAIGRPVSAAASMRFNSDVDCECPYDPTTDTDTTANNSGENLPGLKFHIGGKGSSSKGLSGICCFDMLQESTGLLLLHD